MGVYKFRLKSLEFIVLRSGSENFLSILHNNLTQIWASFFLWIIFKVISEILHIAYCAYTNLFGLISEEKVFLYLNVAYLFKFRAKARDLLFSWPTLENFACQWKTTETPNYNWLHSWNRLFMEKKTDLT